MKNGGTIRILIALALIGAIFSGGSDPKPKPEPCVPCVVVPEYDGPMMALSRAGKDMEPEDRVWLSDAFTATSKMVSNDSQNLIKSTSQQQDIVLATLTFDYGGQYVPQKKYPAVSAEVEKEMLACIGDEVKSVTSADNQKFADCVAEMGKALR